MKRPFFWLGCGLACGAFGASLLSQPRHGWLLTAVCLTAFGASLFFRSRIGHGGVSALLFCMALGAGLFAFRFETAEQQVLPLAEHSALVTGQVSSVKVRANGAYTYEVRAEVVRPLEEVAAPFREDFSFLLYSDYSLEAQPADTLQVEVSFYLPDGSDLFDSRRYYRGQNLFLLGYTDSQEPAVWQAGEQDWFLETVHQLREGMLDRYDEELEPQQAAALKSMLLGDRDDLSQELRQRYTDSGTIHLLAISGMHVSILAGCCTLLLKRAPRWVRIPVLLLVVGGFILLSGVQLSAVRSGVMFGIMLLGSSFHRQGEGINSLGIAVFVIVFSNVYAIMDIGFCMSVLATLGLLALGPGLQRRLELLLHVRSRPVRWGLGVISVSVSANLFLIPVFVMEFGCISLVGPLVNLLASLTAPVLLIFGFAVTVLGFLPLPHFLYQLLGFVIDLQNGAARLAGSLPFASLGLDFPLLRGWLAASLALLGIGWLLWRKRGLIRFGACAGVVFLVLYGVISFGSGPQICVVGDGSRADIVLLDGVHATVITTSDDDYVNINTMRYLKRKNVQFLDYLFFCYPEASAIRDTETLLQIYPPQQVILSREAVTIPETLTRDTGVDCVLAESVQQVHSESFTLYPQIREGQVELLVEQGDWSIWIGSRDSALEHPQAQLVFLTGRPRKIHLSAQTVFLLEKPYGQVEGERIADASGKVYELRLR